MHLEVYDEIGPFELNDLKKVINMTIFNIGDKVRVLNPKWSDMIFVIDKFNPSGSIVLIDINSGKYHYINSIDVLELVEQKSKSNTVKIITERVWKDNVQCRKIVGFKNLIDYANLPYDYCILENMFYGCGNKLLLRGFKNERIRLIMVEDIIEEKQYQDMLKFMRICGQTLYEINNRHREIEKRNAWSGTQVDEI